MKVNKWVAVISTALASLALPSSASAKTAKCEITSYPSDKYVGPCDFSSRKGGSFEVFLPEQADELVFTRYIYINITAPGRGVIGGAGGTGRISEWGRVQRDPKNLLAGSVNGAEFAFSRGPHWRFKNKGNSR